MHCYDDLTYMHCRTKTRRDPLITERRTHHQEPVSDIELERYETLPSLPPRNADLPSDSKALEAYRELETALPNDYEPLDQVNPNFRPNDDDDDLDEKPPTLSGDPPSLSGNPAAQGDGPPAEGADTPDNPPSLEQSEEKVDLSEL